MSDPIENDSPDGAVDPAAICSLTINPKDPEVIAICSMLCFQCGPIAHRLRFGGHDIQTRAEDEQGKVILWLLGKYLEHGADWRAKTDKDLRAMKAPTHSANTPAQTQPSEPSEF